MIYCPKCKAFRTATYTTPQNPIRALKIQGELRCRTCSTLLEEIPRHLDTENQGKEVKSVV